ncbi:MAG TPA: hypothetical protein VH301_09260 [Usitatibacter sp.]|jgi:hypothetical protein|nr:hypothetical protein [Usitatibacter sp.]
MRSIHKVLAAAALAASMFAIPAVHAAEESLDGSQFVKMCDADKDGMVSKAEVMKAVEKMFDKADTKREGKLDRKQVEFFLRELMKGGG